MDFLEEKIKIILEKLNGFRKLSSRKLSGFRYRECPYKNGNALPDLSDAPFFEGEYWNIAPDTHAWFYRHVEIPAEMRGYPVRLQVQTGKHGWNVQNPQFIVYVNGKLRQGLDVNHTSVLLGTDDEYDLHLYAYSGSQPVDLRFLPSIYVTDELCEKVYYDIKVPHEVLECLNPLSKEYADMVEYLDRAVNFLDLRRAPDENFRRSLAEAEAYLDREFYHGYCHTQETSLICIGHTHIDCAWKWTLEQTREKVQRSFSNVLTNMGEYPEYKFFQSQPLLYQYIKEEAPEVYEGIKEKVRSGAWEAEGAMWVESDCNLPSGESFVRQLLLGKRFFREELGVESRLFWVPDVFGYSAALPQILKKSGVDYFITSKLSWNEKNRMPYDIFKWRGIDGSEVNAYFLTSQEYNRNAAGYENRTNYNARISAKYVKGTAERLQQKTLTDEVLLAFGYGDGGGGPTREHLEYLRRFEKGIRTCPNAKMGRVVDFLESLFEKNKNNPRVPTWEGELYFELHRGTLTSIAKNKRNNRKSEFLWQNAEQLAVLNQKLLGAEYPKAVFDDAWTTICTNQFHDIIPGSSIPEVYAVSDADYERIGRQGRELEKKYLSALAGQVQTAGGVLVYNPHAAVREANVRVGDELVHVSGLPSKGWAVVTPKRTDGSVTVNGRRMENRFYAVEFDEHYVITRLYDKKNGREVLRAGGKGNRLVAYEDFPRDYDAWEITEYYVEKSWEIDDVSSVTVLHDGVRSGIRVERKFLESVISQDIWLYEDTPTIDFETRANWQEHHLLVKTLFDTDVHAARATYNIQFGNLERPTVQNTSWDTARFEVCAHKFADLSEGNYGVALMNDCKYGYGIHDGTITLSLIKCATDPNPVADIGEHEFVYSLYAHAGTLNESDTVALSYALNQPLSAVELPAQKGCLPERFSLVSVDRENVVAETVKQAENGDGTIFRFYETANSRTPCRIAFGLPAESVSVCDLQENELETLPVRNGAVELVAKPYEIITLKVR